MKLDCERIIRGIRASAWIGKPVESDVKELLPLDVGQSIVLFACMSTSWQAEESVNAHTVT